MKDFPKNIFVEALDDRLLPEATTLIGKEWPDYAADFPNEVKAAKNGFDPGEAEFFVGVGDGKVIGVGGIAISLMSYAVWNITWLLTDPDYRGYGIGRMLVGKMEDYAKSHKDIREPELAVCLTTSVKGFYEKLGYRSVVDFDGRNDKRRYLMWKTFGDEVVIRPATMPDLLVCHKIMEDCPELHTQGHAPNMWWLSSFMIEGKVVLVAEDNGEVAGCLFAERISGGVFLVHLIAVAKDRRGKGIGEALLVRAERVAKENGYVGVMTYAYADGKPILGLLEKHGYVGDNCYREYWKRCDAYKESEVVNK